ncbi:hypothetical protein F5Y15DRAFT_233919 [Xylariaceae sp. FL0016]|nr:hypothetical protein F5Y15DRAFT_233919 [Xylariaceae sp. FL0016]
MRYLCLSLNSVSLALYLTSLLSRTGVQARGRHYCTLSTKLRVCPPHFQISSYWIAEAREQVAGNNDNRNSWGIPPNLQVIVITAPAPGKMLRRYSVNVYLSQVFIQYLLYP